MRYQITALATLLAFVGCGQTPASRPSSAMTTQPAAAASQADEAPAELTAVGDSENGPRETEAVTEKAMTDKTGTEKVVRTEAEWKQLLTPEQYYVLREKGTERPFQNEFDHHFEPGTYACAACGQELFESDTKFNSGCGWPAFYAAKAGDRVQLTPDHSHGMVRTEVTCARCDSHLGHIFDDAPQTPTGQRYCINSVSLKFIPAAGREQPEENEAENGAGDAN